MTDENPEPTGEQQKDTRFKPGQSGNPAGRPVGSRNKLERVFLKRLYADFKANGMDAIEKTRLEKPEAYLNVIAKILPREINGDLNIYNHEEALDQLE